MRPSGIAWRVASNQCRLYEFESVSCSNELVALTGIAVPGQKVFCFRSASSKTNSMALLLNTLLIFLVLATRGFQKSAKLCRLMCRWSTRQLSAKPR